MPRVIREYRVVDALGVCVQWSAVHDIDCDGKIGTAISWLSPTGVSQTAPPTAPAGGLFEAGECCACVPNPCLSLKRMTQGAPSSLLATDLIPIVDEFGVCQTRQLAAGVPGLQWVGGTDDDPSTPLSLQATLNGVATGAPIPATFLEDLAPVVGSGLQGLGSLASPFRENFDALPLEDWCATPPAGAFVVISTTTNPDGARVPLAAFLANCNILI